MQLVGSIDFKSRTNLRQALSRIVVTRSPWLALVLCLVQTVSSSFFGFANTSPEEQREIDEVNKLPDHALMIRSLNQYLAMHPHAARVLGFRAEVHNVLGHPQETIRDATSYFQFNKGSVLPVIYKVRANAYLHRRQPIKALSDLNSALKLDAKDPITLIMRAAALEQLGRKKEAISAFANAAKAGNAEALMSKAKLELTLDMIEQANSDCVEYIRKTKQAKVPESLIYNLYMKGHYQTSLAMCDAFIDAKVADAETYSLKASSLSGLGRYQEALQACDVYTRMSGDENSGVRYQIYQQWKQPDKAIVYLQKMIKAAPKDLNLYLARADFYMAHSKYEEALADFNRAPALVDKLPRMRASRAECNFRAGKYAEAARDFAVVNKTDATLYTLKFEGRSLSALKKYDDAAYCFSRVIVLKPLSSSAFASRGECYFRLNDYARADKDFSDAITLSPKELPYYYARGECRLAADRAAEAVDDLTIALKEPGLQSMVYAARAKAYAKLKRADLAEKDGVASKSASRSVEIDLFK